MSDRNGGSFFALGLIAGGFLAVISLVWMVGLNYCPQAPCYYGGQEQPGPGDNEYWVPFASGPDTTSGFGPPDNEGHPKYYERQDLRAQETMARATNAIVMLSMIGLGLSAMGAALLIWTLVETRKSSDAAMEANRIMRSEARPWVTIEQDIPCDFIHEEGSDKCNLFFGYTLKNNGKMPAHNISVVSRVYRYDWAYIGAGTQGVRDVIRRAKSKNYSDIPVIFAADSKPRTTYGGWKIDGDEKGTVFLCVCVIYSLDPLNSERGLHAQAFVLENRTNRLGPLAFDLLSVASGAYTRIE